MRFQANLLIMEPPEGIEPSTDGLQNRCSTAELQWRYKHKLGYTSLALCSCFVLVHKFCGRFALDKGAD
ncbi:uncharacterized protein METZ01_LOCUS411099 [marine metagenome]|uniref:Uncharacterized protein n=1 Tax=marine metagenome TaxID=408172 RepID=A0A382WIU2_9ZZZZ